MQQQYYYSRRQNTESQSRVSSRSSHEALPLARKKNPVRAAILVSIVLLGLYGIGASISNLLDSHQNEQPSLLVQNKQPLAQQLNAVIAKKPYKIGVSIVDTKTMDAQNFGNQSQFVAASTGKILTALAFYHQVENGQASLTEQIGSWPASFQLKEMINISDNDSWSNLEHAVGLPTLNRYAQSLGVTDYDADTNMISAPQLAHVLAQLYAGKLLNHADTEQLLSYMQNTNMEQMIPAVAPSNVTVYHKYGLYNGALHDAGILADHGHSYAIVIYTQNDDGSDDLARISVIREIAQIAIKNLFVNTTPLNPPAPTNVDG